MKTRPNVALLIETSNSYGRGLLRGIVRYAKELEPRWSLNFLEQDWPGAPAQGLSRRRADGIIARIETPEVAEAVRETGLPLVDVSSARLIPGIPWVEADDKTISELAAAHLLERGFRHFAYCGNSRFNWSQWCRGCYSRFLEERGVTVHVFETSSSSRRTGWKGATHQAFADWLRRLPKPVGVFACWDVVGAEVLDACSEAAIAVPEEIAVVTVGHDDIFCELCRPPLSSIMPDSQGAGYRAAALLDRMMSGQVVPPDAVRLGPLGVVTRQSTDVLAVNDPEVALAVRFIRDHACNGIGVRDLLRHVPLSRRVLEARFHKVLGRSPHQEILRLKIARAEQFLLETELSLDTIAERTGFRHPEYFCVAFKRATGTTPGRFRRLRKRSASVRSAPAPTR